MRLYYWDKEDKQWKEIYKLFPRVTLKEVQSIWRSNGYCTCLVKKED